MAIRIGLTGGIGSGKSSAAEMFVRLGMPLLDLDRVGHALTAPGMPALARLADAFGRDLICPDGSLNRQLLARRAFASIDATCRLNAIMHPLIRQAEDAWVELQAASMVLIEASVIIESGGVDRMDALVVVIADSTLRLQRVVARGDRDGDSVRAVMLRQCSDAERREQADYLIINNGSVDELEAQVTAVYHKLVERFSQVQ